MSTTHWTKCILLAIFKTHHGAQLSYDPAAGTFGSRGSDLAAALKRDLKPEARGGVELVATTHLSVFRQLIDLDLDAFQLTIE